RDRTVPDLLTRLVISADQCGERHQHLHEGFAGVHRPWRWPAPWRLAPRWCAATGPALGRIIGMASGPAAACCVAVAFAGVGAAGPTGLPREVGHRARGSVMVGVGPDIVVCAGLGADALFASGGGGRA